MDHVTSVLKDPLPLERCFRCQAFGHNSKACTATDRSGECWKCGEVDHLIKVCKAADDRCLACEIAGLSKSCHRPGSGACAARKPSAGQKSTLYEVNFLQVNFNRNWAAEQPSSVYVPDGRERRRLMCWLFPSHSEASVPKDLGALAMPRWRSPHTRHKWLTAMALNAFPGYGRL